jgi:hypothetical protein
MKLIAYTDFEYKFTRLWYNLPHELFCSNVSNIAIPSGAEVRLQFAQASEDGLTSRYNVWYNDEVIGYTIF